MLGVLTVVYTFNFIDRNIIAVLSPAIQAELGVSDTVMGLLKGPAFALLYTTLGIPIAWLADRYNRVVIVSAALATWSGFTALSGFAANVAQLSLARVGVGIGEAGCSPPAHSLIADYFPKEKRASALSIYALGIPIGATFAFLAGGWILQNFGWRNAFLIVGAPGVLLAILMVLTVREPLRGGMEASSEKSADAALRPQGDFFQNLRTLFAIPSYVGLTVAATLVSFTGYGTSFWTVDFYDRTYGLTPIEITLPLAFLNGVVYGFGTVLGGALTDRFGQKNKSVYALVSVAGMLLAAPTGLLALWSPTPFWAFFWSGFYLLGMGLYLGPTFSLVQTLAPVHLRAFATSVFFFILNLIALGGAPFVVGALSDVFQGSVGPATGLRLALSTLVLTTLGAAAAFFWTARKLPADWEAAVRRNT